MGVREFVLGVDLRCGMMQSICKAGQSPASLSGAEGGQLLIPSILKNGNAVSFGRFGARQDALTSFDPSSL